MTETGTGMEVNFLCTLSLSSDLLWNWHSKRSISLPMFGPALTQLVCGGRTLVRTFSLYSGDEAHACMHDVYTMTTMEALP